MHFTLGKRGRKKMKTASIVEFKDLKPMATEGNYRYELVEGVYIFKLGIDDLKVNHDYPIPKYVRITKKSDKKCSISYNL